ncbi:MAG TPA: asparagine synthase-related protein [Candidatus Sulfotelmatobacter sp.]|nr:asparagine synthase-related protein [Candidatus Sulfotelmatobacter sp.]
MSGICGWFGGGTTEPAEVAVGRMAAALPQYMPGRSESACGADFGLATRAHAAMGSFAVEDDIRAALEGYPVWSDPGLAETAARGGHAKALLAAYRSKGVGLFEDLRGTFALAISDSTARRLLLAIDRVGVQTMCYARPRPGMVVFGSTTDAVRAHPSVGSTVALQSIFDYLYFGDRIPAPKTIYAEQQKLVPGEYLLFEANQCRVAPYWRMPYRSTTQLGKEAAGAELRNRLRNAVATCLAGEKAATAGAFLSGGLDSSSVVGFAAGLLPDKLRTFTIGFPVEGFDEAYYAEAAARRFATDHRIYYIKPEDVIDVLHQSIRIYDEPFANSSVIPSYHCARLAKEAGVEMMLAGDGGDELFAGNERYVKDRIFDHYGRVPRPLREALLLPFARSRSFARQIRLFGRIARYIELAAMPVPERMMYNLFIKQQPAEVFSADALGAIDPAASRALAVSIYDAPADAGKVQRMMNFDLRVTLADGDLRKVSRMCEAAGVRVRYPFLVDEVVEFSAGLPEALLMPGGKLRQFYKDVMTGFLPDEIINKQKHGFGLPYMNFMNTHAPLRSLICDGLSDLRRRNYFRAEFLAALLDRAHRGALASDDGIAWDLLVLELWLAARK